MKFPGSMPRLAFVAALLCSLIGSGARAEVTLLNVSYDPTREFYDAYNQEFAQFWKNKTGEDVVDPAIARRLG